MATGNDKNQSPIIAHRLPEFVQTDHPTMVAFIQAYYEWLDQQADQGYVRTPAALDGLADVDKTIEENGNPHLPMFWVKSNQQIT